MAFYFSRRKIKPKEEEHSGELNIVPYCLAICLPAFTSFS